MRDPDYSTSVSGAQALLVYSELDHARTQGAWIHTENPGSARRSFNSPPGVFECANNIFTLDFFQAFHYRWRVGRCFKVIHNTEYVSLRMDNRTLNYIG